MKNRTSYLLVLVALMSSILACSVKISNNVGGNTIRGNCTVVTETRDVSNISSIELAQSGRLHITMGDTETLTIEAEDNLMGYIQTDVSLSRLVIITKQGINL